MSSIVPRMSLVLVGLAACASPYVEEAEVGAQSARTAQPAPIAQSAPAEIATTVSDGDGVPMVADVRDAPTDAYGTAPHGSLDDLMALFGAPRDAGTSRTVSTRDARTKPRPHVVTALRLSNGAVMAGRVLEDDGDKVTFEFATNGGIGTTAFRYVNLHPETIAELMLARADQGDAAALIDIAEFAAASDLYEVARVHYLAAAEADPTVAEIAEAQLMALATEASNGEYARAAAKADTGEDAQARRIFRRVQREFAGTAAADEATARIAEIDTRTKERKLDATREKQLAPLRKALGSAVDNTNKGMGAQMGSTTATRAFLAARSRTDSARSRAKTALRSAERKGDDTLVAELKNMSQRIDEQDIDNELQLGNAYLDQRAFSKARIAANSVLKIDPQNIEARTLLAQIAGAERELPDSDNDVWDTRYRRHYHGRPYPYPRRWYPGRQPRHIRTGVTRTGAGAGGGFRLGGSVRGAGSGNMRGGGRR